jgi:hypothetical protein
MIGFAQQKQERATKRHKKRKTSINSDDSALPLVFCASLWPVLLSLGKARPY